MNQWESARTGRGKACKEGRKLAILPPPEEGENIAETPIWVMKLSPTALKAFDLRPYTGHVESVACFERIAPGEPDIVPA